jgi:short chain dehydrogenase
MATNELSLQPDAAARVAQRGSLNGCEFARTHRHGSREPSTGRCHRSFEDQARYAHREPLRGSDVSFDSLAVYLLYIPLASAATMTSNWAKAHAEPNGPGDARPTAMQILEDEGLVGKQQGRVVIITGASSGIGVETARALHAAGCTLVLPVRNREKGEGVVEDILKSNSEYSGTQKPELMDLDLNSLQSVRDFADAFKSKHQKLTVLICNAGAVSPPY